MWMPGMERYYNENLSPKITYSLGRTIIIQAGLAVLHPGINYATNDIFTPSLLIRPRLQTQSKHSPSDIPALVVNPPAVAATGGKKKR